MPSTRQFVQRGAFALLYRFGRWIYDPLTELLFDGEWDRWRRSILPFIESGPVLDIGCGTGALAGALADRGVDVVGLEQSSSMLAVATKRGLPAGSLVRAESSMLPFRDGTFRACVSTFPADFIRQPPTISEIYRVVEIGGTVAVVLGGILDHDSLRRKIMAAPLGLFYGRRAPAAPSVDWAPPHAGLRGEWKSVRTARGTAFIWLARKVTHDQTSHSGQEEAATTFCQLW